MKAFVVFISLLVSSSAFAETVVIKGHDPLFLQYIESTTTALQTSRKDLCKFGKNENGSSYHDVAHILRYSTVIRVSDGTQPLLVFDTRNAPHAYTNRALVLVTTTPDYKKVLSVEVRSYNRVRVNVGDLKNPKMVDENQRDLRFFCKN